MNAKQLKSFNRYKKRMGHGSMLTDQVFISSAAIECAFPDISDRINYITQLLNGDLLR
jgi:hypothetical protein